MKKVSDLKKIFYGVSSLIIIAGIIMVLTVGFNFGLKYQKNTRMQLNIGKEFDVNDIKQITDEVFENQKVILQKVEIYEDTVAVTTTEVTDEQKQSFVDKINEKYGLERKVENLNISQQPHTRGRDLCKRYITPGLIALIFISIYIIVRYRKLDSFKTLIEFVKYEVLAVAVYFSIIAVCRIPINIITIPIAVLVVLLVLIGFILVCEDRLEKIIKKEKEEPKK